jgi:hypothetical protein
MWDAFRSPAVSWCRTLSTAAAIVMANIRVQRSPITMMCNRHHEFSDAHRQEFPGRR